MVAVLIVCADKNKPRFSSLFSSFTENSMTHPADQKDASSLQNNLPIYLQFESELVNHSIVTEDHWRATFFQRKMRLAFLAKFSQKSIFRKLNKFMTTYPFLML